MENSRKAQFINSKLLTLQSSVMKSHTSRCLHTVPAACLLSLRRLHDRIDCHGITVFVLKSPQYYLGMMPKPFTYLTIVWCYNCSILLVVTVHLLLGLLR